MAQAKRLGTKGKRTPERKKRVQVQSGLDTWNLNANEMVIRGSYRRWISRSAVRSFLKSRGVTDLRTKSDCFPEGISYAVNKHRNGSIAIGCQSFDAQEVAKIRKWANAR